MAVSNDHFSLLGLPKQFALDTVRLEANFKALQKKFHPDNFAHSTPSEQRIAMQYAATINEAFQTLSHSVRRAQYLLSLKGAEQKEHTLKSDPDFLFEQMALREKLASAHSAKGLAQLLEKSKATQADYEAAFSKAYDEDDLTSAQQAVDKLQFVDKYQTELKQKLADLEQ